ncbi:hypothetical protein SNE40_018315 [Patella caerulea]|uniref:Uncharacterized protein n=1 Tax=Patella caerulea TaxID=87958 RepID=A0AAN8J826_PATCE
MSARLHLIGIDAHGVERMQQDDLEISAIKSWVENGENPKWEDVSPQSPFVKRATPRNLSEFWCPYCPDASFTTRSRLERHSQGFGHRLLVLEMEKLRREERESGGAVLKDKKKSSDSKDKKGKEGSKDEKKKDGRNDEKKRDGSKDVKKAGDRRDERKRDDRRKDDDAEKREKDKRDETEGTVEKNSVEESGAVGGLTCTINLRRIMSELGEEPKLDFSLYSDISEESEDGDGQENMVESEVGVDGAENGRVECSTNTEKMMTRDVEVQCCYVR